MPKYQKKARITFHVNWKYFSHDLVYGFSTQVKSDLNKKLASLTSTGRESEGLVKEITIRLELPK